ncbi:glycosyltransferase [Hydrogenophaga sp. 5NK40-0174]|uniref:glycosyltransferase n=1 Tax=Hydrogenophaga sp. 5NK40-0174 TaxID=3127649 RepID=UPI003109E443
MKLLRVLPTLDPRAGGPASGARMIDAELIQKGNEVTVLTLDAPDCDFLSQHPGRVHALGPSRWGYRYNANLTPWLRRHAKQFDAVIVNGIWQYHALGTWRALAGSGVPYFVFVHGMLDPWFKRAYPRKHLKKWLYWPWADYRVLRDAAAVLFTCEEERRLARESFWLYRCHEEVVAYGTQAPPPAEDGRLARRFVARHPELQGKRIFLYLSRIHEKKGCDLLIDAFARIARTHPKAHLVMAGPDQSGWVAALRAQAKSLGIAGRITWPGLLQGEDKWGAMRAAEVFCLPSHQENFGIVVAEALACGTPVLISDKVNIWREIDADGAGMVHPDTAQGTYEALVRWLDLPPEGQQRMRIMARHSFEQRFHIERVASSLLDTMQRCQSATSPVFNGSIESAHEPS